MTALFVVVGAVLGGIIDLIPGVFFGGAIGFLLGWNQELRKRLDKLGRAQVWLEEAQAWFESAQSWFDKAQASPPKAVEQQTPAPPLLPLEARGRPPGRRRPPLPLETGGPLPSRRRPPLPLRPPIR